MSRGRSRKGDKGRRRPARRRVRQRLSLIEIAVLAVFPVFAMYLLIENAAWFEKPISKPASQLTMDEARALNATVPFVSGPLVPAKRYIFHGSPAAKLQATDCLATAALYEAGRDERGQKSVIQVVLNRVRHAGYPKTICGVVYQGSSRRTGCQFTFTCDGSFKRRQMSAGWAAARKAARRALEGYVFAQVGTATHYHTDWVVPYWSRSLDKVAKVNTHIFYR